MSSSEIPPVFLCEPQCTTLEHATFNAALLRTALIAFPGNRIIFFAEQQHMSWVQSALTNWPASEKQRVEWVPLDIPPRHLSGIKRMRWEFAWCRFVFEAAEQKNPLLVIFSSINETGLLALKSYLFLRGARFAVFALLHSVLQRICEPRPLLFWRRGIHLREVLMLPVPRALTYLDLSPSIHRNFEREMPRAASHSQTIDIPYLWPDTEPAILTKSPSKVEFGYFGVRYEGLDIFRSLAEDIHQAGFDAIFRQVGFLRNPEGIDYYRLHLSDVATEPLSNAEYSARAQSIHYAVWCGSPDYFRLVASASFLDALSYLKPGIYLRTPFTEYYLEKLGDIGYLCDNYMEIRDCVRHILTDFPLKRYVQQQKNILESRDLFSPSTVATYLRKIAEQGRMRLRA